MSTISDALFSKATKAVLDITFGQAQGVHLRALMSLTGLGSASAQRELKKLTEAGILMKEEVGNVLLYKPDANSPVYAELHSILQKTEGLAPQLREALLPYGAQITRAFVYGSVAREEDTSRSDIDVFVISDTIGSADLYPVLTDIEKKLGRKISLTVYRNGEFRRKLDAGNHFLVSVLSGPVIELIGGAMQSKALENLVKVGQLKHEAFSQSEFDTTVRSGGERLQDASSTQISLSGKFLLAYGAAYAYSLAALRVLGYRPANRYVVFQALPHSLGLGPEVWRVLAAAHDVRNGFEYEGSDEVTEDLCEQVIRCATILQQNLRPGSTA